MLACQRYSPSNTCLPRARSAPAWAAMLLDSREQPATRAVRAPVEMMRAMESTLLDSSRAEGASARRAWTLAARRGAGAAACSRDGYGHASGLQGSTRCCCRARDERVLVLCMAHAQAAPAASWCAVCLFSKPLTPQVLTRVCREERREHCMLSVAFCG